MSKIYVLASIPGAGKTTTALLLHRHFREQGLRVACLQQNKGQSDVHAYLSAGCRHYTIPLEAAKGREDFEQWVPSGYDVYLFEVTWPYAPIGAAYVDVFDRINETVPYEAMNDWKGYVAAFQKKRWSRRLPAHHPDLMELWDMVRDRTVQRIVTKVPEEVEGPFVDTSHLIHRPELLVADTIEPQMTLPRSDRTAIAVGAFPAEFWDLFPRLSWYGYDYAAFMERYRAEDYDLAVIGMCGGTALKFRDRPEKSDVICYKPSVYLDGLQSPKEVLQNRDSFSRIVSTIKEKPVGTPLGDEGSPYFRLNNRFWTYRPYPDREMIWREENMLFCNGWVLPQYLIREGYLEV
ncbi:hypothetical protein E2N92_12345 [Methanofollis formosanus]|uniref:Uncharacterized protein n=1 Tax=Methanofollis formosanus TaxID=299308 RepID=A0A8G1EHF4_9EURY|nr:hypothetical protein [Methanofollis formosanus]QYZ80161.1 hypothetical protein E2N92_12345 [Methanofollis formosanus]